MDGLGFWLVGEVPGFGLFQDLGIDNEELVGWLWVDFYEEICDKVRNVEKDFVWNYLKIGLIEEGFLFMRILLCCVEFIVE